VEVIELVSRVGKGEVRERIFLLRGADPVLFLPMSATLAPLSCSIRLLGANVTNSSD
jgi:hypothetical protein